MKKYHVVYYHKKGVGTVNVKMSKKIKNENDIKDIVKDISKNYLDGEPVILLNWIEISATGNKKTVKEDIMRVEKYKVKTSIFTPLFWGIIGGIAFALMFGLFFIGIIL